MANESIEILADKKSVCRVSESQAALIMLLLRGLKKFYENDAMSLFGKEKEGKAIDERSMVGCVYRYMYETLIAISNSLKWQHIDIEYNRMNINQDEADKTIISCGTCVKHSLLGDASNCLQFAKMVKDSTKSSSHENAISIRPDLIVHTRNSADNGLVVEFKKLHVDGGYDQVKVGYATCPRSPLHYEVGAFVRLERGKACVQLYKDGRRYNDEFCIEKNSVITECRRRNHK